MHFLLYIIAVFACLAGIGLGLSSQNIMLIGNGFLVGVLFGALGKGLHLLQQIETHIRLGSISLDMAERRWANWLRPLTDAEAQSQAQSQAQGPKPIVVETVSPADHAKRPTAH